jgi:hypothetical protein
MARIHHINLSYLLYLLNTLEFDEENYGEDLILVKPLH